MEDDGEIIEGRIKWFDPGKGFGFIVSEACEVDILLHGNVLRNFGQGSVSDGAKITVRVLHAARGVQAIEVLQIEAPAMPDFPLPDEAAALQGLDIANLPLEPARVKWFDSGKGFGFANVFGAADDVFIHAEVLRFSGLADLMSGEAVALRVIAGRRGRMAVQALSWDAAIGIIA